MFSVRAVALVATAGLALSACSLTGGGGGGRSTPPAQGDVMARSVLPQYTADDTWTYILDGEEVVEKVVAVGEDGRVTFATTDGRRWESLGDPLLPAARVMPEAGPQTVLLYTPPTLPDLTLFPLQVGKAAAYRTEITSADDGRMERAIEHTCEVRGPRQLTVPAGAFTAVEVFCQRGGRFETLYYAPEIRNTVMELRDVDGRMEKKELVSFRPSSGGDAGVVATAEPLAGSPVPSSAGVERESLDGPLAPPAAAPASAPAVTTAAAAEPVRTEAAPAAASSRIALSASADSPWTLQLAAVSSEEAARQAWSRWQARVGSVLPGAQPRIVEGGGLWRLSTGGFASRSEANRACETLQRTGVQCFPRES